MRPLLIALCIASFSVWPPISTGQQTCDATVKAGVEVAPGKFSLADLLFADACPALLQAAAGVAMGSAPSAGSVRVLSGDEVRRLLEKLPGAAEKTSGEAMILSLHVPQRISVRRAGARASCADIGERILASRKKFPTTVMDCGATGRILEAAPLQSTRAVWNPGLGSWEVSTRCVRPRDCVPFLVRVRRPDSNPKLESSVRQGGGPATRLDLLSPFSEKAQPGLAQARPLVRPGETVTLLWEQDGIRLTVPAVCLDAGGAGQRVRARIVGGPRLISAIVVSAGRLRAVS